MAVKSGVQVKGLKETQRAFVKFNQKIGQGRREPFEKAGKWAVDLIISKTTSGKDFNNNSFKSYTKEYATSKGRTKVDLVRSAKMLGAISFQAFTKKLRIYVKKKNYKDSKINTYELAVVHNFGAMAGRKHKAKVPSREFMGLTDNDVTKIVKMVRDYYEKELTKVFKF